MRLVDLPCGWTVGRFAALEALPGVVHAVTTRRGPDVAAAARDPGPAAAALAEALGLEGAAWCRQVHGAAVLAAGAAGEAGPADGLVAARRGLGLAGRSADCPLILVADARGRAVGMAHASWRGTVRRIAAALVERLAALGPRPEDLVACVCPSAGPCCYEVGPDVLAAAREGIGPDAEAFFHRRGGRTFFDLWAANRQQLLRAGLLEAGVHVAGVCTICRNDLFPSHRAEGGRAGRFLAMIGTRPTAPSG